jgi:VIT1/CCC1 family predicted Fe2+/Mn2+ transporter
MKLNKLKAQFLMGFVDGLNGTVAIILAMVLTLHSAANAITVAILAKAVSSGVSMGGAQYQEDEQMGVKNQRIPRVISMALGYLFSALVPVVGYFVSRSIGNWLLVPTTALCLLIIVLFNAKRDGWLKSSLTTLIIFTIAVGAGLIVSRI